MTRTLLLAALLSALPAARAQVVPAIAPPPVQQGLQPFVATYQVFHDGHELGQATLQLVHVDGARWRIDLSMRGSGLMRLTGLNLQQSTVFDTDGATFRPLAQSTVKHRFFSTRKTTGVYDWNARSARWTGDVREGHAGPIALQPGDMSGLLIDLAVIRDAQPGRTLDYRFVDDGRVRQHHWVVAPLAEDVAVGELSYQAMRANRIQDGGDDTILWVASGVPTPIRILQREDGADATDLRLVEYKGAAP
jgi:Protein of unknown function (DUF3108)